MKRITEITRRDIFELFINGMDWENGIETVEIRFDWHGRLSQKEFLSRLYDLRALDSKDPRFQNAEEELVHHTVKNDDYEGVWVFEDGRFCLMEGEDEILLRFLSEMFHPVVRDEKGYWKEFRDEINDLLRKDRYELFVANEVSGRDVYSWREYDPEQSALFIPFSMRHKEDVVDVQLSVEIRAQLVEVLKRHDIFCLETTETEWKYQKCTNAYVFDDIKQFYTPAVHVEEDNGGCDDKSNEMRQLILDAKPVEVFDAIEFYEKRVEDKSFRAQVNALFKLNSIPYRLEQGKVELLADATILSLDIGSIPESGLRNLIIEADGYYRKDNKRIAVEKLWDAFERLKTFYLTSKCDKKDSVEKLIKVMSGTSEDFFLLYEAEFNALTKVGNGYRIRHHEINKKEITDNRQYDYLYKRCLSLISLAILYLREEPR